MGNGPASVIAVLRAVAFAIGCALAIVAWLFGAPIYYVLAIVACAALVAGFI